MKTLINWKVFLILLVALETKFPHGRGTILVAPFLDLPKPEDGRKESPNNQAVNPSGESGGS